MLQATRLWEIALPALIATAVAVLFLPIVEVLKLWLSRRSWAAQERWKLKVSTYERLITSLNGLDALLEPRYDSTPPTYPEGLNEADSRQYVTLLEDLNKAYALATLWLPAHVSQAILLVRGTDRYADPSCWRKDVHEVVCEARHQLLEAVSKDLNP